MSRIVASLGGPVIIGRTDVDVAVAKYGVAHLRDVPIHERARGLVAVAAPQFSDQLQAGHRTMKEVPLE